MANAKLGSTPSFGGAVAYKIDSAITLGANAANEVGIGSSGSFYFVEEGSAAYTITLPSVTKFPGWHAKFILKASPASYAITIAAASGDEDTIKGIEFSDADTAAATDSDWDSVVFGTNGVAGDYVEFVSDGTNWYAHMHASADNAFSQND